MVPPALSAQKQRERHDEQNPGRRGYWYGWEDPSTVSPGESESGGETAKLAVLHSPLTVSGSLCETDAAGFLFFASPAEKKGMGLPAGDLEHKGELERHALECATNWETDDSA